MKKGHPGGKRSSHCAVFRDIKVVNKERRFIWWSDIFGWKFLILCQEKVSRRIPKASVSILESFWF